MLAQVGFRNRVQGCPFPNRTGARVRTVSPVPYGSWGRRRAVRRSFPAGKRETKPGSFAGTTGSLRSASAMTRWSTPTVRGLPHTGQMFPSFMDSSGSRTTLQARCPRRGGTCLLREELHRAPEGAAVRRLAARGPAQGVEEARRRRGRLRTGWPRVRDFRRSGRRS